jgi:hypothetical protein
LDGVIRLPIAIAIVRLIGPAIMAEHRASAAALQERPTAMVIITIWLIVSAGFIWLVWHLLPS